MLGMSLQTFTMLHVAISLVGIVSGLIVVFGLISGEPLDRWTALFLATTVLTDVTGFMFPFEHLLPSHIIGTISLVVLAVAIVARYVQHLAGAWKVVYATTAVIALYFNVFVAVVQSFLKVPALNALAPTQKESPFFIAQTVVLLVFIALGVYAVKGFRKAALRVA